MTHYYYIKLYHEVLDDIKMGPLPDHLWRRCVELFLLAGINGRDGKLPTIQRMCWKLRTTTPELVDDLVSLEEAGILSRSGNEWIVTNFAKRQDADTVSERVKRYRERKSNEDVTKRYNNCNENVTNDVTKMKHETYQNHSHSIESDINVYKEEEKIAPTKNLYQIYSEEIGVITPSLSDKIDLAEKDYSYDWVKRAMEIASQNQKRSWAYIETILKNWQTNGFDWKPSRGNGKGPAKPASHDAIETYLKNLEDKNGN